MSDGEPRVWVGLKQCGRCVAVVIDDDHAHRNDVEATTLEFLRDGLSVVSASWREWRAIFMPSLLRNCEHAHEPVGDGTGVTQ